jgi:hypothetical protein
MCVLIKDLQLVLELKINHCIQGYFCKLCRNVRISYWGGGGLP